MAKAAAGPSKLAETIRGMDRMCGDYGAKIEALAEAARTVLGKPRDELPAWRRATAQKLLEMIVERAAEMANAVNYDAEQVGCNYVEEADDA